MSTLATLANEIGQACQEFHKGVDKFLTEQERQAADFRRAIEQAHMAGQAEADIDPSYSDAQAYYLRLKEVGQA